MKSSLLKSLAAFWLNYEKKMIRIVVYNEDHLGLFLEVALGLRTISVKYRVGLDSRGHERSVQLSMIVLGIVLICAGTAKFLIKND